MRTIHRPYLLFLGDAPDKLAGKTALGIAHWNPEAVLGQLRLPGCALDVGVPDRTIAEAAALGVKTLVIGVVNRGGVMPPLWLETFKAALEHGMDIANGLHTRLTSFPELVALAAKHGRQLHDVRHFDGALPIGTGEKRSGKRLLTVGTDCSIGKKFTALVIADALQQAGRKATFRATGQTGILISGSGIAVDAVVADFIAGAVEMLTPANEADHWDIIEGQGSLLHPSFAGVTMGLVHGAQPDALVLCVDESRTHMRGVKHPIPSMETAIEQHLTAARLTNPAVRLTGISAITEHLDEPAARRHLADLAARSGVPATDSVRFGVADILKEL